MKTQAYSSLPKLALALCIASSALVGCGGDDTDGPSGNTGGGSSSSTSATGGGGDGGGGDGGGAASGTGGGATSGTGGSGGEDNMPGDTVRFIGRFDEAADGGPRFAWPGTGIATRFSGTSISVRFNDESKADEPNYFEVVIDGESKGRIEVTGQDKLYPVVKDLPDGEHDLLLHRRTEGLVGVSQFVEFVPQEGEALLPVKPAPERRIEVIGDSISAGYGVDGPNEMCPFTSDTENNYLAYSALTARMLGAEASIIAWSGRGAYRNYDGEDAPTMPEIYGRTIPSEDQPAWDFSSWKPQVVVINLGTNDFSINVPSGQAFDQPFRTAYAGLVETVRTNYPEAFIFCTIGPMLSDSYPEGAEALTRARTLVTQVVNDRTAGGDERVRFVEFPPQDGAANGLGCDYHPSVKTNELMAEQLAGAIREELGW